MFTFSRATLALALALTAALSVAGCATPDASAGSTSSPEPTPTASSTPSESATPTPTPTPEPTTPPDLSTLVLSTDGLGPLVLNQPMPAGSPTAMALYDPTWCTGVGAEGEGDGAWIANYPEVDSVARDVAKPFDVHTADFSENGELRGLLVLGPEIETAEGIHVGSTTAELLAAYPNYDQKIEGLLSDAYSVSGATGQLMFEVAKSANATNYWPAASDGTIVWIRALAVPENAYVTAGTGDDAFCRSK